jgi:hypothetical protein
MKKIVRLLVLLRASILACSRSPANGSGNIGEIRKGRPWIPATTSLIQKDGQWELVDFIAYQFENDPAVLGSWQSVDFVKEQSAYTPGVKSYTGELLPQPLTFLPNGVIEGIPQLKWTKGHFLNSDGVA